MLFKSNIEINKFAPIATTTNFDNLSPIIRAVEEDYLVPILGQTLYAALISAISDTSISELMKGLLQRSRDVVAPLVAYNFTPLAEVKLSDAGAQRTASQNFQTAYQNQVVNFRNQCVTNAMMAIERLYRFLEKNISQLPEWSASDEFKNYRSLFIKTGGEFNAQVKTSSPYTNYYAMRSFMADVENNIIKKLIGQQLFAELKEAGANPEGTFTETQRDLLKDIRKATAFLTIATAIPFLDVRLDGNGFTVMNTAFAQNDELTKRSAAEADRMSNYIAACKNIAGMYINNISEWMKENATEKPESAAPRDTGNNERKGTFGFF